MGVLDATAAAAKAHGGKLVLLVALVLLAPGLGSTLAGTSDLRVVANAPEKADAMTVDVSAASGLLGGCGGEADVDLRYKGRLVYGGDLANAPMDGCDGHVEIPYDRFASANGPHTVHVTYDGMETSTVVDVRKVVNWVYLRAFPNETAERTRIGVALNTAQAQPLSSGVFTSGTLELDILFEECTGDEITNLLEDSSSCQANGRSVFFGEVPVDQSATTHVIVPWENLGEEGEDPEEGWYNVTATFHNDEARANRNVPMDPTLFNEDPPATWFEVEY